MSFVAGALTGGLVGGGLSPVIEPLTRGLGQAVNSVLPNVLLTPNDLIDLHHRGAITQTQFFNIMQKHGLDRNTAKLSYYAADSLVTPEQAVSLLIHDRLNNLYGRELYSPTIEAIIQAETTTQQNYALRAKRQGYRPSEAQDLFNANRPLPTFSTILEWMAKEVFEPDKIAKFTLAEEQPPELAEYMAAYGVPSTEARKYWISHWNTIGRAAWDQLYQRFRSDRNTESYSDIDTLELAEAGVTWDDVKISKTDYNDYYTVLELSPYFRSRGRGAVYNPLPFTVLQQLWQYGVLTYNQMVGRLRDYGYSKRSSELILEAWQRKFPYGYREPLRNNIVKRYELRKITRATAEADLATAGVTADAITFLLNQVDDAIDLKKEKAWLATLQRTAYQESYTEAQIKAKIDAQFPAWSNAERDYQAGLIMNAIAAFARRINLRLAGKALGEGGITVAQFRTWCNSRFIGTSDQDIAIAAYNPST